MPTAAADSATTPQGVPVTIAVLANDAGEGALAVQGYTEPGGGALRLNPDQTFTYTPNPGFVGDDAFAYTVRDAATGGTATATVAIAVTRPNAAPLAEDDAAAVPAGGSVVIPVLANDGDPDGDELALVAIEAPGHGTVQVEPGGENLRYTPQEGFVGSDSFAYAVGDGRGATATAAVTVAVDAPNGAPAAVPDRAATQPGTPVTIDVLANDDDPEAGPLTLVGVTLPAHGTLALTAERRFVYTPEPGFAGQDGFAYTVRDAGGLAATGGVVVEVAPRNAAPAAQPDAATVAGGVPLRLDLIANDNDPDGDPLRLTGLTLPAGGRIAVNPDQSVTYTPNPGFSGSDGFTYTVSDGAAEAQAEVALEVVPPAGAGFANGYRYRRRLVLPAAATATAAVPAETVRDVVLLVRETRDWLRSAANGGGVESEAGFDLRFETGDGTRLDHELERYDPAGGELAAWVRLPSWRLDQAFELFLYHGRPGLAAAEAPAAGTWRGYLAVWDTLTGADRSGQGRDLQPTGVLPGSLIAGCGRFDGASVARRADAAFLGGLPALTVQAVLAPEPAMAGSDRGFLAQGPMTGDDEAAGLSLSYLARSPAGVEAVVAFRLRCADGDAAAFSAGGAHAAAAGGGVQVVHATWRQGEAPALHLDGAPSRAAGGGGGPARGGPTAPPAGGLYLGAGGRDPATGGWRGLVDEVRIRADALPAAWIAFEATNLVRPPASYGLGGEDRADDPEPAPVALPLAARVAAGGGHVDLDPLAAALRYGGGDLALAAVESPAFGKATIVDGRLRYAPRAGFLGTESFAFTVQAGGEAGKRSTALATVTVAPPAFAVVDDLASTGRGAAAVIDVLRNDAGGPGLAVRAVVEDPEHGTATVNAGGSVTYRPDPGFVGADGFAYRAGDGLGQEGTARVSVTVTDGAADLPYAYAHKPADAILPASDADVVVWNVPAAGGVCPYVGNAGQVLLLAAPAEPIRGTVSATNLQFKAVFLIGATFRPQGVTSLLTPNGTWVRGGDALRIGFSASVAVRPVLFLANVDHDARNATEANVFGDFLQTGTARPAAGAGDPDGSANRERWAEVYLQKIKVAYGSASFGTPDAGLVLLSSFFRPRLGGVGDVYGGQLDLRWHGPAFLLQGQPAPRDTVRPDARLFLHRVALRALGAAASGDPLPAPPLFHLVGGEAGAAAADQVERGNYQAALFDQVSLERYLDADGGSLAPYFVPSLVPGGAGGPRYDSAAQAIDFPAYRAAGRLHPLWTGAVAVGAGRPATVSDEEVGAAWRVTGAAKLREVLTPSQDPPLRAVDDRAATARDRAVEIDLLGNDVGAEDATVTLGAPGRGSVALTPGRAARYTPTGGRTGADSFSYTLVRGDRSSTATVSVDVVDPGSGGWGAGPRSGDRWWTGFGDVTGNSLGLVAAFERLRNRPVDIVAVWAPKGQIETWDDIAGGPGEDPTAIGGTLTKGVNNRKVIWDNPATRALPVHLNLVLVPPGQGNRQGRNPGVWWDYADGAYDGHWRRLGRRLAHLDAVSGRTAPLVLDLGWEHSGPWYAWSIAGARDGVPAHTKFPLAFARIAAAVRAGHRAYAGRDCPYRFCWRPSRVAVAAGVPHRAFYPGDESVDLMGMSNHERDPYLTPAGWATRTSPWPAARAFTREGWDPFFDFCESRGKKACFPEWSPLQTDPEVEPSPYPEELIRLTRAYMERRSPLFAYDCFFNGDGSKITANPAWGGTTEYVKLWGRR